MLIFHYPITYKLWYACTKLFSILALFISYSPKTWGVMNSVQVSPVLRYFPLFWLLYSCHVTLMWLSYSRTVCFHGDCAAWVSSHIVSPSFVSSSYLEVFGKGEGRVNEFWVFPPPRISSSFWEGGIKLWQNTLRIQTKHIFRNAEMFNSRGVFPSYFHLWNYLCESWWR